MAEGRFDTGGAKRFYKAGGSLQENSIELPGVGFEEQASRMELSGDAELIAENYEFGAAVGELLETTPVEKLTTAVCEAFLFKSAKFKEYHPGTVLAVAKVLTKRKLARN